MCLMMRRSDIWPLRRRPTSSMRWHSAVRLSSVRAGSPPSQTLRKVLGWIFSGFSSLLLAASVVCFIAWYDLSHILFYCLRGPVSSERLMKPGSQEASREPLPASAKPRPCRHPSTRRRPPDGLQCVAGLFDVLSHGDTHPDDVVVFRDGVQTAFPLLCSSLETSSIYI